jgi:hypothetical protein
VLVLRSGCAGGWACPCGWRSMWPPPMWLALHVAPAHVAGAGIVPPLIAKPLVACGVEGSHTMALVAHPLALRQLAGGVPVPAMVQEFANHGGVQYKAYSLGDLVRGGRRGCAPARWCHAGLCSKPACWPMVGQGLRQRGKAHDCLSLEA